MPWIAHVGIKLDDNQYCNKKNTWNLAKTINSIEYRWKLSDNNVYHYIAGLFNNPQEALDCMKSMYVNILYEMLLNDIQIIDAGCDSYITRLNLDDEPTIPSYSGKETFFFWTKNYQGGQLGPGVYEVDSSLDEFDEYRFIDMIVRMQNCIDLNHDNPDNYIFSYNEKTQEILNDLLLAEHAYDYGMKVTIYCALLEHIFPPKYKSEDAIKLIDSFKKTIENSTLVKKEIKSLLGILDNARHLSAKERCITYCKRYAREKYDGYSLEEIITDAYKVRNLFAHGNKVSDKYNNASTYIKYVVLDAIKGFINDKKSSSIYNGENEDGKIKC